MLTVRYLNPNAKKCEHIVIYVAWNGHTLDFNSMPILLTKNPACLIPAKEQPIKSSHIDLCHTSLFCPQSNRKQRIAHAKAFNQTW